MIQARPRYVVLKVDAFSNKDTVHGPSGVHMSAPEMRTFADV